MHAFTSHGQVIEIELRAFGALAWLAAGFEVRVGGRRFHPKLDSLGFNTSTDFDFTVEGKRISGCVRSLAPMWFFPRMRYSVVVEDQEIARDRQMLKRWYLCYFSAALLFTTVFLALVGASALVFIFLRGIDGLQ